jgi:hypothetical protein
MTCSADPAYLQTLDRLSHVAELLHEEKGDREVLLIEYERLRARLREVTDRSKKDGHRGNRE